MKLSALMKQAHIISGNADIEISSIAYDSRKVMPGDVFVCIKGYATDGHSYVQKAIENGAVAIVAQDEVASSVPVIYVEDTRLALAQMSKVYYDRPDEKMKIIGVTGTNGKTTVTYLIKHILEQNGAKVGLIGTNQNMIGTQVLETERTTPESKELYAMFADMAAAGCTHVVMEVSSHALELSRVGGIRFAVGVFTNLTQDHLDFHGDMENYFLAKAKLFGVSEKAVINIDDAYGARLEPMAQNVLTYSIDAVSDLQASAIEISAKGVLYDAATGAETTSVHLPIPGRFSVYNSLAAIGCVLQLGMDINTAVRALLTAKGVKGRAEVVPTDTPYTVLIDYAHTPDGLENIISTVNEFKTARVITVFGCGGDRDRTKRPLMGETAARLSDFVVVTSDNPRTEDPEAIIEDILPGVLKTDCPYVRITNRKEAIAYALSHAQPDDIIVLAGKGHETYQILNTGKIHFDERAVVAELLNTK